MLQRYLFGSVALLATAVALHADPLPDLDVPMLQIAPAITAKNDDPAWKSAAVIPTLTYQIDRPDCKLSKSAQFENTTVLIGWRKDSLYIRFLCQDSEIYSPFHNDGDPYFLGDSVEVFLDPIGNQHQWFEIIVSPDNGVLPVLHLCTGTPESDENGVLLPNIMNKNVWNIMNWKGLGAFPTAARRTKVGTRDGWIADIAIPAEVLRPLGWNCFAPMSLRANFIRNDKEKDASGNWFLVPYDWSPVLNSMPHVSPARMGYLRLLSSK